ncbi:MAG TPA: sigma-70 family RNA polymerase sigma factor [Gemmataceae bacterium]|nr:sigma-70 family RNA polymerase sigma factor [Gemmataceae bacterium]
MTPFGVAQAGNLSYKKATTAPLPRLHLDKGVLAISTTPLSLLERIRTRDPDAWRRLIELYQPLVRFWCSRGGLQGPDAEDAVQEIFAAAAANLDSFHHDQPGDTFRGWLRSITRNQVRLHFRRNQGRPQAEGGSDAWRHLQDVPDPLTNIGDEETIEMSLLYKRALEQVRCEFEEHTWQAFWLSAVEDRTPATLSEQLGMSPAAIRQAKSRVLRRLKQEMGELLA